MTRDRRVPWVFVIVVVSLLGVVPAGAGNGTGAAASADQGEVVAADHSEAAGPASALAARLSANSFHTCAVLDNGTVRCWGGGGSMLGLGRIAAVGDDEAPASVDPIDIGVGRAALAVATGRFHSCALLDDGTVRCWGRGDSGGQLGYGNTRTIGDDETPGTAGPVNLGPGRTAVAIAAGGAHTCAILDDGSVRCWGRGDSGRLGYGDRTDIGDDETPGSVGPVDLGVGRTAVAIAAGEFHTCAVLDEGNVRCWGLGRSGRLGYGGSATIGDDETPGSVGPVDLGVGRTAVGITAGVSHTCALLDNGAVRCWGSGRSGQLGYGNTDAIGNNETPGSVGPVNLGAGRTAVALAAGEAHTCAVLDNGVVRCWGSGSFGQLGYANTRSVGDDETPGSVAPVKLSAGRAAVAITTGDDHTCAVLDDGALQCWGFGFDGALGYGNRNNIGDDETPASVGPVDIGGTMSSVALDSLSRIFVSNRIASGRAAYVFLFGRPNQPVVVGDWDGDGVAGFAARSGNSYVLTDEIGRQFGTTSYGKVGDAVHVGDWDGDGIETLAVRRGNVYFLKNVLGGGRADVVLGYGRPTDEVFVGDWNGNGQDSFAVRRGNVFYVRNRPSTGVADVVFAYGLAGDEAFVGDWDGDGIDTFAVRRDRTLYIRNALRSGVAQTVITYGDAADELLVGDYDGDGVDTFAARRRPSGP